MTRRPPPSRPRRRLWREALPALIGLLSLLTWSCGGEGPSSDRGSLADLGVQQAPNGESHWLKLSVSRRWLCGITVPGRRMSCRRPDDVAPIGPAALGLPAGAFDGVMDVAVAADWGCLVQEADGALACFGAVAATWAPPEGPFVAVSLGERHGCAQRASGEVVCFGDLAADDPRLAAPSGPLSAFSAGSDFTCGLRAEPGAGERPVTCWGHQAWDASLFPTGAAEQIASGRQFACAASRATGPVCEGEAEPSSVRSPPGVAGRQLVAGDRFACVIDLDDRLVCWGDAPEVPTEPVRVAAAGGAWLCFTADADPAMVRCVTAERDCSTEVVNDLDDDCDGTVDEGLGCVPEVPDLLDNDCDGVADLPFLVELSRFVHTDGVSHRTGVDDPCFPAPGEPGDGCGRRLGRRNPGCAVDTC